MNTKRVCIVLAVGSWLTLFGAFPISVIPAEGFMGMLSTLLNIGARLVGLVLVITVIVIMARNAKHVLEDNA